jgi:hypothetical protein
MDSVGSAWGIMAEFLEHHTEPFCSVTYCQRESVDWPRAAADVDNTELAPSATRW